VHHHHRERGALLVSILELHEVRHNKMNERSLNMK
jgi:hypothetical protein